MFTESEKAYIRSQRLARLATVDEEGQPDNSAVGFRFDGRLITIGGHNNPSTRKYKNVEAGQDRVSVIIDDLESVDPWKPRGIRIYGRARLVHPDGRPSRASVIEITPEISWSWNVEAAGFRDGDFKPHRTVHS